VAKLTGLSAPVAGLDAANKTYVDNQDALKLSLTGGTMSGALNMGTKAISNAASLAINGTSSSDALTLSKATGGAAYTLALPAAAPIANTYLGYTGTNYAWGAGTNSAAQFAYATTTETVNIVSNNSMVPSGWYFPFNVTNITGNYITSSTVPYATNNKSTTFTLAANNTYKCSFSVGGSPLTSGGGPLGQIIYGWYNITTGEQIGVFATQTYGSNSVATGYIVVPSSGPRTIGLMFSYGNGVTAVPYAAYQFGSLNSWATIEVVSNNNIISQFTGATSAADGAIGYIPKPLAGQENYTLKGSGGWSKLGLGLTGEIWRDVKSVRVVGTSYPTVLLPYPLQVSITYNTSNYTSGNLSIDGILVSNFQNTNTGNIVSTAVGIVPAGSRYVFACSLAATINSWSELY
jgi:hypothetical protein